MTKKEFLDNKEFVVGHKMKIKTLKQIEALNLPDNYQKQKAIDNAGKTFISFEIFRYGNEIQFYGENDRDISIEIQFLNFTKDKRQPNKEAIKICKDLIKSKKIFFMGTCGEMHGESETSNLTKETVYPVLDRFGNTLIHIPNCGMVGDVLSIDICRQLLNKNYYDASFNTGMSYIKRELFLYTKEESEKKSFVY